MPKEKYFKENVMAAGVKTPTDVIKFEFELSDDVTADMIEYIVPDCGVCTKAMLSGNKVIGTLDVSKARHQYDPGKTPITKTIYVYMNDGRPRFIGKENTKEMIANPDKEFQRLNVACVVSK